LGGLGGAITCLCCLAALGLIGLWVTFIPFVAFFSKLFWTCLPQNSFIIIFFFSFLLEYAYDQEVRAYGGVPSIQNLQQIVILLAICLLTIRFAKRQMNT
jgi:hypothetical protein